MRRRLLLSCVGLLLAPPAFAESDGLAEAERAYQSVDFPATHALAEKALEAGGADREETARLYVLLGISAAAQDDAEAAKSAFVVALAVKPSLKLDKGLSPKIRDPYLEAQGYWGASSDRLSLNAKPSSDQTHLVIDLRDPAGLVSKLEVHLAASGSSARSKVQLPAAPTTRFAMPAALQGHSYEYSLSALDRSGNVLAEHGSEADPELVHASVPAPVVRPVAGPSPRGRSYVLPVSLGIAGLGAVAAGVVFQVKRESAAREWNSSSCEQPGQTRVQQCQSVDESRQKYEHLAIGFYAAGGALLTGGLIALVAGHPAESPNSRAGLLGCGFDGAGVRCNGRF